MRRSWRTDLGVVEDGGRSGRDGPGDDARPVPQRRMAPCGERRRPGGRSCASSATSAGWRESRRPVANGVASRTSSRHRPPPRAWRRSRSPRQTPPASPPPSASTWGWSSTGPAPGGRLAPRSAPSRDAARTQPAVAVARGGGESLAHRVGAWRRRRAAGRAALELAWRLAYSLARWWAPRSVAACRVCRGSAWGRHGRSRSVDFRGDGPRRRLSRGAPPRQGL